MAKYLINGIPMSLLNSTHGNWYGTWQENKRRKYLHLGKDDPRTQYPLVSVNRKWARETTTYVLYGGILMTLKQTSYYCGTKGCHCRPDQQKHGPYWKGHYWQEGRHRAKHFGREMPADVEYISPLE